MPFADQSVVLVLNRLLLFEVNLAIIATYWGYYQILNIGISFSGVFMFQQIGLHATLLSHA